MFIVYFLEYTVCTGFCERANHFGYVEFIDDCEMCAAFGY